MKKRRITYAVAGMMEYQITAMVGKNRVNVSFTGGSTSNGCSQPARYSTENLIIQDAIERCIDFKRGRIFKEREETLEDDLIIEGNHISNGQKTEGSKTEDERPASAEDHGMVTRGSSDKESRIGIEIVDASCKDAAKQYLQDHFGENPTPLRTRNDVQECAAKHGIEFNFV